MIHELNAVGDCEVGKAKKACRNCTCGRAEEEAKVLKLGLTSEQINNPQSACGNVSSKVHILKIGLFLEFSVFFLMVNLLPNLAVWSW